MSDHIYKHIELTGSSKVSSDDAVRQAISRADESIDHIGWFKVEEIRGCVKRGEIEYWQVTVKFGFRLDDDDVS